MNPNDLRDGFLRFFTARDHVICPSDRLIPENDPSLLFTPAGMNQFKDMFRGIGNLDFQRATSSQKCLRMPDLDNVGRTASHHTFFEMLGNFSFGDYFKEEAIAWAIEYLVDELGLDFGDLAFSIYHDDDDAAAIWLNKMNVTPDKLYRFGEKSNFWPAEAPSKGPNGVCGPCSEIFVDFKGGCGQPGCNPDCDCGRFVEVWNLVFTQFERKDGGILEPLPRQNIDTGMGFERLLRVLEGVPTNFDTSLFQPIIQTVAGMAQKEYGVIHADDVRLKRVADHLRAAVFCIAEGIQPSNEKQGYVIRKVLRRAMLDGSKLGIEGLFLSKVVPSVVQTVGLAYPELTENQARIEREILAEEEKFSSTFRQGLERLEGFAREMEKKGATCLAGQQAFLLYDTFGFPLDITVRFLEEKGWSVDVKGFNAEMDAQRERARKGSIIATEIFDTGPLTQLTGRVPPTTFVGYDSTQCNGRVLAILTDDGLVDSVSQGMQASLILDRTPFYAEAGGQVGDRGSIVTDTFTFTVNNDTRKEREFYLHTGVVTEGTVSLGDTAEIAADLVRRKSIQRNHTATHLLHWALRRVLGDHVEQAGSLVEEPRLRFDFLHSKAMTNAEMAQVQSLVNRKIRANIGVDTSVMPIQDAKNSGAMALFGEKYGDDVRVVGIRSPEAEESSIELCGGTHVGRTGEIGSFWILSEESIAAGVRRIEAATSVALEEFLHDRLAALQRSAKLMKVPPERLPKAIEDLQQQLKDLRKEIARGRESKALEEVGAILEKGRNLGENMTLYAYRVDGLGHVELKKLIDKVRGKVKTPLGIILISKDGERANFVAAVDQALIDRGLPPANEICGHLGRMMGGGGGGRPLMAQGQGHAGGDLDQNLEHAVDQVVGRAAGESS